MKSISALIACASLIGLLCAASSQTAAHGKSNTVRLEKRLRIGMQITPVPLDLRGKNLKRVALGSYFVNALGGCNDCHTHPSFQPGGNPYLGEAEVINVDQFLSGGRQFGPITSRNITPDEFGRPGGLTFEEFASALRTGRDPETGLILQVMPWPLYSKLRDADVRAIYEYLRAIPSLPDNPNPSP